MTRKNDRDDEIRKMFRDAREAEIDSASSFRAVRDRETQGARRAPRRFVWPRLGVGAGSAVTACGLVIALGTSWILMRGPDAPAVVAQHRSVAEPVTDPVLPTTTVLPVAAPPAVPTQPETTEPAAKATRAATSPPAATPPIAAPRAEDVGIGSVSVVVGDDSGTPLPGAHVTISNAAGTVRTTTELTDREGHAEFPVLRSGPGYSLQVAFPGFAPVRFEDVQVSTLERKTIAVKLVEVHQERVQVAAETGALDRLKRLGYVGDSDPPAPGRFYQNVLTLAEGTQDAEGDGNPNVHGARSRDFERLYRAALVGQAAQAGETQFNTETYDEIRENGFLSVRENALSTFSIDVDTASYANVRRFLESGRRPPRDAVRIEDLLNYFDYEYPEPTGEAPFAVHLEVAECPWNLDHHLARIGLKGRTIDRRQTAGSNLVFLIDVSGSMQPPNKLPLLKSALAMLVQQLDSRDQVAIVVYAGASGLVLPSTPGDQTREILRAIEELESGGTTNGGAGLKLAYNVARKNFIEGGVNRVILATDGDFNVGVTSHAELLAVIERDAKEGIFLTALGFGMGNYKDGRLEMLTARGNGNYAYIDRLAEARKVLVDQMNGTLVTIAKDVKIQVEFNPAEVGAYRLIGYENRMLRKEDFNDDRKDAGEIGSGHTVTALYELAPAAAPQPTSAVDPLRYQLPGGPTDAAGGGELLTVRLRYKEPDEGGSRLIEAGAAVGSGSLASASVDFKFAAAVAEFGLLLRDSAQKADASFEQVQRLGLEGRGGDRFGYRAEFYELVERAKSLWD